MQRRIRGWMRTCWRARCHCVVSARTPVDLAQQMCKLTWHQLQAAQANAEADAGLDADLLAGALPSGASECMSGLCQRVWHFPQAAQADVEADAGLDADLLAGALPEAGGDAAVLREGLAVSAGGWPLPRCRPPTMLCYHNVSRWSTTRAETRGCMLPAVEQATSPTPTPCSLTCTPCGCL